MVEEAVDVVYTWVDGAWPGYAEQLALHARRPVDLNPNRYRDNLEVLRYSMRSLASLPWVRRFVLVTQRPQVPPWLALDHPRVRLVHHDEFMPQDALPTFSSFAIVANLCRIEGLSRRFLYVEDDTLALRPLTRAALEDEDGKPLLFPCPFSTEPATRQPTKANPWNVALQHANALLEERLGPYRRRTLEHAPMWFDLSLWRDFEARFADALAQTTRAKFRDTGSVPVEHMFPWFMHHVGAATLTSRVSSYRATGYVGLDNWPRALAARLAVQGWRRPLWCALNDNFDQDPHPRSVAAVRAFLNRCYGTPLWFERDVPQRALGS